MSSHSTPLNIHHEHHEYDFPPTSSAFQSTDSAPTDSDLELLTRLQHSFPSACHVKPSQGDAKPLLNFIRVSERFRAHKNDLVPRFLFWDTCSFTIVASFFRKISEFNRNTQLAIHGSFLFSQDVSGFICSIHLQVFRMPSSFSAWSPVHVRLSSSASPVGHRPHHLWPLVPGRDPAALHRPARVGG